VLDGLAAASRAGEARAGDVDRRRQMSARGRALVDGLGAKRAAEKVLERRARPRTPEGQEAPR